MKNFKSRDRAMQAALVEGYNLNHVIPENLAGHATDVFAD